MSDKVTSVLPLVPRRLTVIFIGRFGRSLHVFHQQLEQERGRNPANTQMLQVSLTDSLYLSLSSNILPRQDAFSLLAYPDPWNSTVGGQLDPSGREPVCAQLNSAILGKMVVLYCCGGHVQLTYFVFRIQKPARPSSTGSVRGSHLSAPATDVSQ